MRNVVTASRRSAAQRRSSTFAFTPARGRGRTMRRGQACARKPQTTRAEDRARVPIISIDPRTTHLVSETIHSTAARQRYLSDTATGRGQPGRPCSRTLFPVRLADQLRHHHNQHRNIRESRRARRCRDRTLAIRFEHMRAHCACLVHVAHHMKTRLRVKFEAFTIFGISKSEGHEIRSTNQNLDDP